MSYFEENVKRSINVNYERKISGKINSIPFGFPRFDKKFVGIVQGTMYAVTGATGSAKTQLTKNLFLTRPILFILLNPELKFDYKMFWFGLEESKEDFFLSILANAIYIKFDVLVDTHDLMSRKKDLTLTPEIRKYLDSEHISDYFKFFEERVVVIDHLFDPISIYKEVRKYSDANGKFYVKDKEVKPTKKDGVIQYKTKEGEYFKYFTHYKPNNSDEYVLIVVDHVGLIEKNKNDISLHQAISSIVTRFMRLIFCKKMNYIGVSVHQQVMDGEKESFKGDDTRPSLAKLGDNKVVGRDYQVVLGIYNPYRYKITNHNGYNTGKIRDRYREILMLKNRLGSGLYSVPCAFYGECNQFYELPEPSSNFPFDDVKNGKFKS